uniref:V-type proton ATPase subunit a n=1 Tax=Hymenolepis diminuta TaxID=6216 RepID=A0A0R3SN99_HYMDI
LQLEPPTSENITDQMYAGQPYPFGIDAIWRISNNKIPFMNSLKMKISIIIAVFHMGFGVVLKFLNNKFYNQRLAIWCVTLPQLLFLLSIFGYLVIVIFCKWGAFTADDAGTAPSLLMMLINMFKFNYEIKGDPGDTFYSGQAVIQSFLVILAVTCVPWMFLVKPLILRYRYKRGIGLDGAASNQSKLADNGEIQKESGGHSDVHDDHGEDFENFDLGECMIYSAIDTIEYCLGCISNTASYLRLWALKLSEVLWSMVMRMGLQIDAYYGSAMLFLIFAVWAGLTVGVLVLIEGLSAFLHALRLHWQVSNVYNI